jgi:hypothetical protein
LSTQDDDLAEPTGEPAGRFHLVLRGLALIAAVASLVALWSGERRQASDDLQLIVEPSARPGEVLAVRALLLRHVDAPEGPALAQTAVDVTLFDEADRELARIELSRSALDSMQGSLPLPANVSGTLRIEARAPEFDPPLTCRRTLTVDPEQPAPAAVDRLAGRLQQLVVGRVHATAGEPPPRPFAPRVVGGSCVPEARCRLLVLVGEPAASVRARANSAVQVLSTAQPANETTGLVQLDLRIIGAEAEVTLEATRGDEVVAERALRLPIALGEPTLELQKVLLESSEAPAISSTPPPGRKALIVDAYSAGRWTFTHAFDASTSASPVALERVPKSFGIVRLQARSDLFSADSAATRVAYWRAPGESDRSALLSMLRAAAPVEDDATPHLDEKKLELAGQDVQRWASFLLAPLELARMRVPVAASGRSRSLARLAHARTFLRFGVGAMLVLSALVVGGTLLRRGLKASQEAGKILHEGRDVRDRTDGGQLRDRIRVVLWVLAVGMAFLAAALLIVAKPLWF